MSDRHCKDCVAEIAAFNQAMDVAGAGSDVPRPPPGRDRPAPHPGPRCATHHRVAKKARRAAAHEAMVQRTYGLGHGDYDRLLDIQGGTCALCQRATGATRKLSVDHDHATGAVRGLLCRPCNNILGHARDDRAFFRRAVVYLAEPPAGLLARQAIQAKWDAG